MIEKGKNKEIISLWIGSESQKCAFSYYHLQAQQIFDEQQDPLIQSSIWKKKDNLQPRMIVFDTKIDRLAAVRQVNNSKIIKKMQKQQGWNSILSFYPHIDTSPLQKVQQTQKVEWPEMDNWTDKQDNYFLIDKHYITIPESTKQSLDINYQRYHTFQEFYQINRDNSENIIRRQLQKTDFLKLFTICTDENYCGYTSNMIQYLRQECPKKAFFLVELSQNQNLPIVSFSKMYDEVDLIIPINLKCVKHPYFKNSTQSKDLAPLFSSLLTPFAMKQVEPSHYLSSITMETRKLFNSAFSLPIIDSQLNLNKETNVFDFQESMVRAKLKQQKNLKVKKEIEQKLKKNKQKKNKEQNQQQQEFQNRINFTNQSYLSLYSRYRQAKFLSQSYILKGQFNNLEKYFSPKAEALSIKYLKGIYSSPELPAVNYQDFYKQQYGQKVEVYPYHVAMFSHQLFGESLRQGMKGLGKLKIFNQEWPEGRQKILQIADCYLQAQEDSD